ncbi:hypothetical protein [Lysobacter enzymogenes]|uniref:hypothetical protein n=1 Tax=Lysobacter enzymogenes TaxID=69 RepID=UPI00094598B9|nr:hypothetical protein [Lysobacter enzymogenes]
MSLLKDSALRSVLGIGPEELKGACMFLQGAVYCWCKNRPQEWFALRDLMGGENTYWLNTPLAPVYRKHSGLPDGDAFIAAGKDAGWILKRVIAEDAREFDTRKAELVRQYRWLSPHAGQS